MCVCVVVVVVLVGGGGGDKLGVAWLSSTNKLVMIFSGGLHIFIFHSYICELRGIPKSVNFTNICDLYN